MADKTQESTKTRESKPRKSSKSNPEKSSVSNAEKSSDNKNSQPVNTTSPQNRRFDEENVAMEREISVNFDQPEHGAEIDDYTESFNNVNGIERTYSTM